MAERTPDTGGMLEGRSILIVGGSTGIGRACSIACLDAGAHVTVTSHDEASLRALTAERPGITAVLADARDPDAAEGAVGVASSLTGRLDGLVHVAGGSGRSLGDGALHEITDEGWRATVELNLTSVFLSNRIAVRRFLAQGAGGAIVNIGSVLATHPAPDHFATHAYAAAKAGLEGFTRAVAARYAGENIRANVVAAGLADTPMARRAINDAAIRGFVVTKQRLDGGRPARAGDFGPAVAFLLSDGARFITGQILAIDGGWPLGDGQFPARETAGTMPVSGLE